MVEKKQEIGAGTKVKDCHRVPGIKLSSQGVTWNSI
jgi:hypothetical protein